MDHNAVVFLLFGQSNAVGHGIPMAENEKITVPLKNVFGLHRAHNQSYDCRQLTWSGYTGAGMNLGETQDDTHSVTNCLARQWQAAIDGGAGLPDLYIVHIAIGAQGVTEKYMWYPDREKQLVPGPLGDANISLHPLAVHLLSLLPGSMASLGKTPRYLLHWRGGEEEMCVPAAELAPVLTGIYRRLFADYDRALGEQLPVVLHRIICTERAMDVDPTGAALESMELVNKSFEAVAAERPHTTVFDVRDFPGYVPEDRQRGLFLEDVVHFTPAVNDWVAGTVLNQFL